ncbi:MAG: AmmeMemoRadiSam system protein B [Gammaproteobacteria bacterium]|nr:AmmeMemoRadiSam system protein B [Gammaproteobacteria bacterium]
MKKIITIVIIMLGASSVMTGITLEDPALQLSNAERIRPSAVAGSWYPGEAGKLKEHLEHLLSLADTATVREKEKGAIRALISPHAGYMFSGFAAALGFKLVQEKKFRLVIVLGPAHRVRFKVLSIVDADYYETPLGKVPLDTEAVGELRKHAMLTADPDAHRREHSIEMQLPFLQHVLAPGWKLVPILTGEMKQDDYALAAELLRPLADEHTLTVASGDFTHYGPNYGYLPFSPDNKIAARLRTLDMGAYESIQKLNAEKFFDYRAKTGITACAFGPTAILLNLAAPQTAVDLLRYYTSGEITKNYTNSVSYLAVAFRAEQAFASAAFSSEKLSEAHMKQLHRLARQALEMAVSQGDSVLSSPVPDAGRLSRLFAQKSGAFVTLKKDGELRGCIGYINPVKPLFRAVFENAVHAAIHDRRFRPVTAEEISELEVEVSVLTPPQPIASHQEFQTGRHGIILLKNGRQAVFLPEVAVEQGWNREQTLTYLSRKAGLPPDAWKEGASFQVFTSRKYSAKE